MHKTFKTYALPVEYKVDAGWDHLDSLELGSHIPRVVVDAELGAFRDVEEDQRRALTKQEPRSLRIHVLTAARHFVLNMYKMEI